MAAPASVPKRRRVTNAELRSLHAAAGTANAAVCRALQLLRQQGHLAGEGPEVSDRTARRHSAAAVAELGRTRTSNGPLLANDGGLLRITPQALLTHLCAVSPMFQQILRRAVFDGAGAPLQLVAYCDELTPGNVLKS